MKRMIIALCALACATPALANDRATFTHLQNVEPFGCTTKMGDVTVDMGVGMTNDSAVNALLITVPRAIWTRNSDKLPSAVGTRLYARTTGSEAYKALVVKSGPAGVTVAVDSNFFGSAFMDVFGINLQRNATTQSPYTPSWSMADQAASSEDGDLAFRMKAAKFLKCVTIKEGDNV